MNPFRKNLSLLDHLEELRSCLIKSLAAFSLTSCVCYYFAERFLQILIKPVGGVVFTSPSEGFLAVISVTFFLGAMTAAPFITYQIWAFVSEALTSSEQKYIKVFAPLSLMLFFAGILFSYFVIIPVSLKFLLNFSTSWMTPMIRVSEYIAFVGNFALTFGVVFELPLVIVFLAKIGVASPEFLRQKRRCAILLIFIISTILTPPDCSSQFLMALPLIGLYELGIIFARAVYRERL